MMLNQLQKQGVIYSLFLRSCLSGIYLVKYVAKIKQIKASPHDKIPFQRTSIRKPNIIIKRLKIIKVIVKYLFIILHPKNGSSNILLFHYHHIIRQQIWNIKFIVQLHLFLQKLSMITIETRDNIRLIH